MLRSTLIPCLDETIDGGWAFSLDYGLKSYLVMAGCWIIVGMDSTTIASRLSRPTADATEIIINEHTIMSAYQAVKQKMPRRIGQL